MNGKTELVVSPVIHLIVSKRHIPDRKIEEVLAVGCLKARHGDVGFGIELLGDTPADAVQLHAVQSAAAHFLRQHPEEVADAHCRFQNVACPEAHIANSVIDCLNDGRSGVVRVQSGGSGSSVFFVGQKIFQFRILSRPCGFVRVKSVRQPAPAHILRKNVLLLRGGLPVLTLDLLQGGNGFGIAPELFLRAAFAQMRIQDTKVFGGRCRWRVLRLVDVEGANLNVIGQIRLFTGIKRGGFFPYSRSCLRLFLCHKPLEALMAL